jgi:hypothetical protein
MQLDEQIFKNLKQISTLEDENNNLKNRLAMCEKELAEAQKKPK